MRLTADQSICIGAGNCVHLSPDVFDQDEDGLVVLQTDDPSEEYQEAARRAVETCPTGAIAIADDAT